MQRTPTVGTGGATEERLREWLVRGLSGDEIAYRRFLEELGAHLRAFLRRRMSRMPDDVEDLVQETLLAIHNQRHTYDADQPLTPWAHAIAKYKLVDLFRRRAHRGAVTVALDHADELLAGSDHEAHEARRDLGRLLALLPERQRLPIVHVKIEGLSVVEAAQRTGMSVSAVKVGVHRGLKALAARMRSRS
ncbi:MAG TPA: sigma-70 family RNA polymerase sigma factor [Zeimonas sp.]